MASLNLRKSSEGHFDIPLPKLAGLRLGLYLQPLRLDCTSALHAIEDVKASKSWFIDASARTESFGGHPHPNDVEKAASLTNSIFREFHSFLIHTAKISKMLWADSKLPSDKALQDPDEQKRLRAERRFRANWRAEELRRLIDLPDVCTILKSRVVRDLCEHADEYIDDAAITQGAHGIFVGNLSWLELDLAPTIDQGLLNIALESLTLTMCQRQVLLEAIEPALKLLSKRLDELWEEHIPPL